MKEYYIELLGIIAAILTTVSFVPQAYKVYKTDHTISLSYRMYIIICSGFFLWMIYGIYLRKKPIIFANLFSLILALYILWKILKSPKTINNI
jgi:MtN3 and saliva related transmembrane protein